MIIAYFNYVSKIGNIKDRLPKDSVLVFSGKLFKHPHQADILSKMILVPLAL